MKKDFDIVIFGGTGDLALRKLLPSLYRANYQGEFATSARILVTTRKVEEVEQFDSIIENALRKYLSADELNEDRKESFLNLLHPVLLDAVDRSKGWADFEEQFNGHESKTRVFYLAVMPSIFGPCCENLSHHNLITPNSRVVVEKPIGYDFESAEKINETIALYFQEEQIYRIDHYLGKETVQNLLALRFGNFLFENIWDAKSIDHVQISISEVVGLEGRAGFYENAGAMRDMVQNHLLQLLCLIAMESPNKLQAEDIRVEKIKVLRALKALDKEQIDRWTVAGQYDDGVIDGLSVDSYLNDLANDDANQSESPTESRTETFVAMKTFIDNWRWANVPFYIRTGKRLPTKVTEVVVTFKKPPHHLFIGQDHGSSLI